MLHSIRRRLLAVAALLLGWAPAFSGDWYVDAWNGLDTNGGTSPADAWRSVTHALAVLPAPAGSDVQRIHLAPAIYDASSGEVYPLVMRPRFQLLGTGGPVGVILQGAWSGALIRFESWQSGLGESFDEATVLARLTLEQAGTGVSMYTNWGTIAPRLEDLYVWQMTGAGIAVSGGDFGGAGIFDPVLERVEVWDTDVGLSVARSGAGGSSSVSLIDCVLRDGPGHGVQLSNVSDSGGLALHGLRSVVRNRSADALHVSYTNGCTVLIELSFCELTDTADDGLEIEVDTGLGGIVTTRLSHCTITGHADAGLAVSTAGGASVSHPTELSSSILWGNGDDLREDPGAPSVTEVRRCDIGDGDYLGVNGTFAADPLFVAPNFYDYRVAFDSPCVDAGEPLLGLDPGQPSLGGVVPPVDGDLDLTKAWDVGAREFAPLQLRGTPRLGATVKLETWGPAGGTAQVYWLRGPTTPLPRVLTIGDWWLGARAALWTSLPTDPATPGETSISIPNVPALIGQSFSFEALVAPATVLTNPVSFLVEP